MDEKYSAIITKFGIFISNAKKNKSGFTITHNNIGYNIRKTDTVHGKINASHYIKECLHNNGFKVSDRYLCALDGNPYVAIDGKTYVAEENKINIYELPPCDFSIEQDRIAAVSILAKLHKSLRQIKPPQEHKKYLINNRLPESYYITRRKELTRAKKWIMNQSHMSDFDILFLRSYDTFIHLANSAIALTKSQNYRSIVTNAMSNEILAHCKYKEETIRMLDGEPHIIGFENCSYQPQIFDLGDLIRRCIKKIPSNEAVDIVETILETYTNILPLKKEERQILFNRILLPDKYLLIINRYFNKRKTWIPNQLVVQMENVQIEQELVNKTISLLQ